MARTDSPTSQFALDVTKQTELPLRTIASPFGEITYPPSQIVTPKFEARFARGPEPLGASQLEWIAA